LFNSGFDVSASVPHTMTKFQQKAAAAQGDAWESNLGVHRIGNEFKLPIFRCWFNLKCTSLMKCSRQDASGEVPRLLIDATLARLVH
jgi:hypothetical protein